MIGWSFHFRYRIVIHLFSWERFQLVGFQKHLLALSFLLAEENLQIGHIRKSDRLLLCSINRSHNSAVNCSFYQMWPLLCCSFRITHHLGAGHSSLLRCPGALVPVGAGPPYSCCGSGRVWPSACLGPLAIMLNYKGMCSLFSQLRFVIPEFNALIINIWLLVFVI